LTVGEVKDFMEVWVPPGGDGVRNAVGSNCMSMDCSQNAGQLPCPSLFSSGESTHQPKIIMIPV